MSRHRRHFRDPREGCQMQPSASSPPSTSLPPASSPPSASSPSPASSPSSSDSPSPATSSPPLSISTPPTLSPPPSASSPPPQPPRADPGKLLRLPEELRRTPHWVLYNLRWSPGRGKWDKL
ncbi:MAG: hypothetical protein WCP58_12610, partial [bacterium]